MFKRILIANRGEIACRVIRTAQRMGIETVAIYSHADADAPHVHAATLAEPVGPAPVSESYLNTDAIRKAIEASGADAVHPGYGFLSENAEFAEMLGKRFIGPSATSIRAMGLKDAAKARMEAAGVPVVPGYHGDDQSPERLAKEAGKIGYPVLIKARAGGGGKGMRKVDRAEGFADALASCQREASASFGDPSCLVEKWITTPRHIEVQVFGDTHGNVVHLFERDCSLQRRHQKVIEEAPAPGMSDEMRSAMCEAAVTAAKAINYVGAGTIEFIVDATDGLRPDRFYFMEMNTRLQVEHPVTEAITGLDLVEWQIRVAAGEPLPLSQDQITCTGWAMEARVYAEDPFNGFLPSTGTLHRLVLDDSVRVDSGVREGDEISPYYDPMIAKLIAHGDTREDARRKLVRALKNSRVAGVVTNLPFLARLAEHEGFVDGQMDTGLIATHEATLCKRAERGSPEIVAALIALGLLNTDPGTGWTLWGPLMHRSTLLHDGELRTVQVQPLGSGAFLVDHEPIQINRIDGDLVVLSDAHGRSTPYRFARHGSDITIWVHGMPYLFHIPDPLDARSDMLKGDAILAPMPGQVLKLSVAAGDQVSAGQPLAVLEAMKMEHALNAPRDGVISEVLVATGAQVSAGDLLIALEALPDA